MTTSPSRLSTLFTVVMIPALFLTAACADKSIAAVTNTSQQINQDRFEFIVAEPNTLNPKKIIEELRPGETAEESVILKNDAPVPMHFSIYGADETTTQQGSFSLKTRVAEKTGLGKWIQVKTPEIDLQPNEVRLVNFTITVPPNTPFGDFSGGIAAEKSRPDKENQNITIAVRTAIRIDVKVTNNPQPIPKQNLTKTTTNTSSFFKIYFIVSLVLFVICLSLLVMHEYQSRKNRRLKNNISSIKKT